MLIEKGKKKKKTEPIKNWNSDPMIRQQLG